jgi:hypothetical protein
MKQKKKTKEVGCYQIEHSFAIIIALCAAFVHFFCGSVDLMCVNHRGKGIIAWSKLMLFYI